MDAGLRNQEECNLFYFMKDSKCKQCRRAGEKLFLKSDRCFTQKCAMVRSPKLPGVHGAKRRRAPSEYGVQLNEKQKAALDAIKGFLEENKSTGVQQVLDKIIFDMLKMICVFPAGAKLEDSKGNVLPDCYLMPENSTALDFAFRLHTDFGKNFIKAIDMRTKQVVGKEGWNRPPWSSR